MNRFTKYFSLSAALSLAAIGPLAYAAPVVSCVAGVCTATIAGDVNATVSNFQAPGTTATTGYTIVTSDSGGFFSITLSDPNAGAIEFTNLYLDTTAGTAADNGSNLGLSFGATGGTAFIPGVGTAISLAGTGITSVFTVDGAGYSDVVEIPDSFLETDPTGIGFGSTDPGGLVTLHLSQSFSYAVVGGSQYGTPLELGGAALPTVTPEPSSLVLLGTGILGVCGAARRRFKKA